MSLGEGSALSRAEQSTPLQMLEASGDRVLELPCVWHTRKDACWLCPTQRSPRWPVGQAVGSLSLLPVSFSISRLEKTLLESA